jgi:hypothetical protein
LRRDNQGERLDNVFVEAAVAQPEVWGGPLKACANGLEARIGIGQWFRFYNERRLRQALRYKTPGRRGRPRWAFWVYRCAWTTVARRPQLHRANNRKTWYTSDGEEERPSPYKRAYAAMSLGSTADIHLAISV